MKVLIVSDSHGRTTNLERIIHKVSPIDLLIHLGDVEGDEEYIRSLVKCEMAMVSGNNDYFTSLEREMEITIGKYTVFLCHGHKYRVNWGTDTLKETGRQMGADIVMFGHTHVPIIDLSEDVIVINPGSITLPRQDGHIPTYIIMELDRYGEAHFTLKYVK